jgi:hypothetical protein
LDAILTTVANGRRLIVDIDREATRNKVIYHLLYHIYTEHFQVSLGQPLPQRLSGVGYAPPANYVAGGANGSIMVGMIVSCDIC